MIGGGGRHCSKVNMLRDFSNGYKSLENQFRVSEFLLRRIGQLSGDIKENITSRGT